MADPSQQNDLIQVLKFEWLTDPLTLSILGFFIGVFGIILAIIFFLKGRRVKKPRYVMASTNLIKNYVNKLNGIEISYKGNKISNLTITKIAIWNDGNDTIDHGDVASSDPLVIRINGGYQILDASIIHLSDKTNGFKITSKNNALIRINFDFMDHFQGIVVQLLQ